MICLNTNVLYGAVCRVQGQPDAVARLLRRKSVCHVSALTDYETRKVFWTHGGAPEHLERLDTLRAGRLPANAD